MGRKWNKAWETGAKPKKEPTTVDLGQNRQAGQRRQFRTSQHQDHDMSRTMQRHCCVMGPVIAHGGKNQRPDGVRVGQ